MESLGIDLVNFAEPINDKHILLLLLNNICGY